MCGPRHSYNQQSRGLFLESEKFIRHKDIKYSSYYYYFNYVEKRLFKIIYKKKKKKKKKKKLLLILSLYIYNYFVP